MRLSPRQSNWLFTCYISDEELLASNKMLGLNTELSDFPSFNLRRASFAPGLERVIQAVHRTLLHKNKGTEATIHAPLVPVLCQLMLHFIDEWEVFALLSHLINRTAWLDYSMESCEASQATLLSLLHSHAVSSIVMEGHHLSHCEWRW